MRLSRIILLLLVVCTLTQEAQAQLRMIPRERVESVAFPEHSSDSAAMQFDRKHINAGTMNEDDAPSTFVYKFTNVGKETLVIKRLTSSCSCVSAVCTVREVTPGASAEISVRYNPKGHPGRFERRVFVYTQDGDCPSAILSLTVDVSAGKDMSREWPVQMGKIRMRRSEITFSASEKGVEKLRFINVGRTPLRLDFDKAFLPECLSVRSEPEIVAPGAVGMIVVALDPSRTGVRETMKVIVGGLGVPPSQSSITVTYIPNDK